MQMGLMDLGGGVGIFATLLIGGLAGWIAEKLTRSNQGLLTNIVVGILGSFVGGWLANLLGLRLGMIFHGWFWGNLIVSVFGAVVLITGYRMLKGQRR
ncbi:MAG TPA: GlsB/YeaQ/YmgE family stress response membrane protein [Rhizobiales bacterium]|nr:GlsB/YeaQ/YmgE family stress response membrane protein [Hyphomicrobiales bacterium]